jgi:hypothetical protein
MGRYMVELGITPASRSRVVATPAVQPSISFTTIYEEDPREKLRAKIEAIASRMSPAGGQ